MGTTLAGKKNSWDGEVWTKDEQQNYLNTEETGFQGKNIFMYISRRWIRYQQDNSLQISEVYECQRQKNKPCIIKNVATMNERKREKTVITE